MTLAWVLGSRGLLGSAICRSLSSDATPLFSPRERFYWSDESRVGSQIEEAVLAFSARAMSVGRWEIYWAAGMGTMSSSEEVLAPETRCLSLLLQHLQRDRTLMGLSGGIAFLSSAGAIYAGSADQIITENTLPAPTTPYAYEKLRQEALVGRFANANDRTTVLIARTSTVYGLGQAEGKPQGLLTQMARCMLRNTPIHIYVPFDMIRDYIAADDAASEVIAAFRAVHEYPAVVLKIVSSEKPTTIAEIVATFRRLSRHTLRVVTSASPRSSLYSRRVQFRSVVPLANSGFRARSLAVGIFQLIAAERAALARGGSYPKKGVVLPEYSNEKSA